MNTQMRTAVITGAAQGLGRVTAETLVEAGFAVMLLDLQPLDAIVTELRAKGHTAHGLSGDIADEAFVQHAAAEKFKKVQQAYETIQQKRGMK